MSKLFVDEIVHQSSQGSGTITLGASGETISVPSGATINLSNATQTGVGESNINSFFAHTPASFQSIANATNTKVQASVELFDSNGCYDTSTYKFTVPSGQGGKYFFSGGLQMRNDNLDLSIMIAVNGSIDVGTHSSGLNHSTDTKAISMSKVFNLSAGDYVEMYVSQQDGSSQDIANNKKTFFCGFKVSS